jgi:probable addiction module antidote protein
VVKLIDIAETFEQDLQDSEFALIYLEEALSDGLPNFLIALRNVIQANKGMTAIASGTELGRESLYKALSEKSTPQFATIEKILHSLGMKLAIVPLSASK